MCIFLALILCLKSIFHHEAKKKGVIFHLELFRTGHMQDPVTHFMVILIAMLMYFTNMNFKNIWFMVMDLINVTSASTENTQ